MKNSTVPYYRFKDNYILVDCDGVLLDWHPVFVRWMHQKHDRDVVNHDEFFVKDIFNLSLPETRKYVCEFNESAWISTLPPFKDSVSVVNEIYRNHGYKFIVITSMTLDKHCHRLREQNLINVFGTDAIFEDFIYLDTGADKTEELRKFEGTGAYWVDDKPGNCIIGDELGLNSIWMDHELAYTDEVVLDVNRIRRSYNWRGVYNNMLIEGL